MIVEDVSAAKGILDYVQKNAIETLVLGASKMNLLRFKAADVSNTVMKRAPSFCTVYAISKGKISSMKSATSSLPSSTLRHSQTSNMNGIYIYMRLSSFFFVLTCHIVYLTTFY